MQSRPSHRGGWSREPSRSLYRLRSARIVAANHFEEMLQLNVVSAHRLRTHGTAAIALLLSALAGCEPRELEEQSSPAAPAEGPVGTPLTEAPTLVGVIEGLSTPESVRHDPELDVYFISNIAGHPTARDNNGFIARVHPDSLGERPGRLLQGGQTGITLHAPKGLAITGDTLWVADIDFVRGFNRRTGRPLVYIDLRGMGAVFLNDVAVGPDGALYVTDTGLRFGSAGTVSEPPGPSRIYRVAERTATVALETDILTGPNGIAWDSAGSRFLIAPFSGPTILAWSPQPDVRGPNPRRLAAGPGSFDGIELFPGRRVLVTTWADSSLYQMDGDTTLTRLISGIDAPADLGVDRRRNRVLIPLFNQNRVVVYELR